MTFASIFKDKLKGLTNDPFAPGTNGIRDHSMESYLANIEKNID